MRFFLIWGTFVWVRSIRAIDCSASKWWYLSRAVALFVALPKVATCPSVCFHLFQLSTDGQKSTTNTNVNSQLKKTQCVHYFPNPPFKSTEMCSKELSMATLIIDSQHVAFITDEMKQWKAQMKRENDEKRKWWSFPIAPIDQ